MSSPAKDGRWEQVRLAYAMGLSLRELARSLGISENTLLARARRERWTEQIEQAKALQQKHSKALAPAKVVTATLATLGEKSRVALAKGLHKGAKHVQSLDGAGVLQNATEVNSLTKASSQVFGWSESGSGTAMRLELIAQGSIPFAAAEEVSVRPSETAVQRLQFRIISGAAKPVDLDEEL